MMRWDKCCGLDVFLAAKGYPVPTMTIYQDNKSTILLAENDISSSSKRTCHINIQYFFVTDKTKKGEVLQTCLGTSSRNHYRAAHTKECEASS